MQNNTLIESLVKDCQPALLLRPWRVTAALVVIVLMLNILCVVVLGARDDLIGMLVTPQLALRNIILLWSGTVTAHAAISMAYPQNHLCRYRLLWPLLLSAIGPIAALAIVVSSAKTEIFARLYPLHAVQCVGVTLLAATLVSGVLAYWLRSGAPTHLNLASWLCGISGGAFGALAYSWHCPHEDPLYIGLWYAVAVAIAAILTRLWVKPFIRW